MPSPFVEELERLLTQRNLSWRRLADLVGYHPSWLSKVRHGAAPSASLVRRCDDVLEADGKLIELAAVKSGQLPAQLPAPPAGFVGRESELQRLRAALTGRGDRRGTPIVAIDGPPGVGKTALALRSADDVLRSEPEAFPDGQLYADLKGYSKTGLSVRSGDVLEEFLVSLGISVQDVPAGTERRAKLYRTLLSSRRVLVVLDNVASSEQAEPLLPAASGCAVVLTSRRRLSGLAMRVGLERILLRHLTAEASVELLATVIGSGRAEAEAGAVGTLTELCGHLPLALRIAADRVAAHPHHPISELVEELAAGRHRLDGLASHDSVTVRSAFEWSYCDLTDDEARTFRFFSLHPGTHAGVASIAALLGRPVVQTQQLLQRLHEVHLLEGVSFSRYRFHDLLRLYAAERLQSDEAAHDRRAAVGRLIDWYLHTSVAGARTLVPFRRSLLELPPPDSAMSPLQFEDDEAALRWFDTEAATFVRVLRLAVDHGFHESAWKLAVGLYDYFCLLRKPGSIWLAITAVALEAARAADSQFAEGWLETGIAEGYRWQRQYKRAQQHFERSLSIRRRIRDLHGQAWTLGGMGFLAVDQGRWEQAHVCAREAMSLFAELGDHDGSASVLLTLADSYRGWYRYEEALHTLDKALEMFEEIGNHAGQGQALTRMAGIHTAQGRHASALVCLERALETKRAAGSRGGEAECLYWHGCTLERLGERSRAVASWTAALRLYEELGDARADEIRARLDRTPRGAEKAAKPGRPDPVRELSIKCASAARDGAAGRHRTSDGTPGSVSRSGTAGRAPRIEEPGVYPGSPCA
ncbi:tetratricopeptide repeat protein [Streptomyces sp. CSDS2]|uniref:ATP-binding protein n=1 Tax=Streptomyces sp. CSDS2 TaxID=3055051 RepID=UPI0025B001B8|nr:tetratricopeptide repeat protein [Streptomyces sp. CSDS2]MDN3265289.1 tetratricopeptide repeat protein [Streptomyces sp. CSDS2]